MQLISKDESKGDAKQTLLLALDTAVVTRPYYSVLANLTSSSDDTRRAISDVHVRSSLAEPVIRYVSHLSESEARQVLETVHDNPGAIHGLHDDMTTTELLATAAIFLWKRIDDLDDYRITAPTVVERMSRDTTDS